MPEISQLLRNAHQQVKAAEGKIEDTLVEGAAGGGMVKVFCRGNGNVFKVEIAPDLVDPDAIEPLEDLLVAAFNDMRAKQVDLMMGTLENISGGRLPFSIPRDNAS